MGMGRTEKQKKWNGKATALHHFSVEIQMFWESSLLECVREDEMCVGG